MGVRRAASSTFELRRLDKLLLVLLQLELLQLLEKATRAAAMFLLPLPAAAYRPLLPSELRRLKSDRYAVIPNWLTPSEVDALRADALAVERLHGRAARAEHALHLVVLALNQRDAHARRVRA